ncbi:DUF5711 family protein [Ruminococcaceae bacterium OttesenSCG-928-A16]|nr:DUF5711 family protein [Ruminococcaceae bacterium OttesenSCG-928-A16]
MAKEDENKRKKKKPKHTNLAVPGGKNKARSKGLAAKTGAPYKVGGVPAPKRPVAMFDMQRTPEQPDTAAKPNPANEPLTPSTVPTPHSEGPGAEGTDVREEKQARPKGQTMQFPAIRPQNTPQQEPEALPPNARKMPKRASGHTAAVQAGRRKKRGKYLRVLIALLVVLVCVLFYTTGLYLSAATSIADMYEGMRLSLSPGQGFPTNFAVTGYKQAKPMGNSGFAALGDKDLALVGANGEEQLRVQHGYVAPAMAVGPTRVCVYNRGSTEYTVTNRSKVLLKTNAENGILFTSVSSGGSLALATASQYRATVQVYSPSNYTEWRWNWSSAKDIPIQGVFDTDNKTLALACVSSANVTLSSVIYLFKTDRSAQQGAEMATIAVTDAVPVQMEFMGGKLLVLYDTGYAALYNKAGQELARYDYAGQSLHTASMGAGKLALIFGSFAQDNAHVVLLNSNLELLGQATITGTVVSEVLATKAGVFVLAGKEVLAYSAEMQPTATQFNQEKSYGLVWANQPLLLTASGAQPIHNLLTATPAEVSSPVPASVSVPQSVPPLPEGASPESEPEPMA